MVRQLVEVLAEHGMRVLVVEHERQFADRLRGEWIAPWGVAEVQRIEICRTLLERCTHEVPYFSFVGWGPARDLRNTCPGSSFAFAKRPVSLLIRFMKMKIPVENNLREKPRC